jgi:hypothetical protein
VTRSVARGRPRREVHDAPTTRRSSIAFQSGMRYRPNFRPDGLAGRPAWPCRSAGSLAPIAAGCGSWPPKAGGCSLHPEGRHLPAGRHPGWWQAPPGLDCDRPADGRYHLKRVWAVTAGICGWLATEAAQLHPGRRPVPAELPQLAAVRRPPHHLKPTHRVSYLILKKVCGRGRQLFGRQIDGQAAVEQRPPGSDEALARER